jgi:hypothetical protein
VIAYAGPLVRVVALNVVVTVRVHTVPQELPWQTCPEEQLVTVVPHWPHELHVTYPVVLWHFVAFPEHAGLGGHWHAPPLEPLAQIWLGSEQPAQPAPPFPHEEVD